MGGCRGGGLEELIEGGRGRRSVGGCRGAGWSSWVRRADARGGAGVG